MESSRISSHASVLSHVYLTSTCPSKYEASFGLPALEDFDSNTPPPPPYRFVVDSYNFDFIRIV
jgi:hypothetical protein